MISYSFVVKNTGNVTLAGPFTVNDNKVGAVSCPPGSLAPGASVTCTTNHTITQADLDAGALTNIATASGNGLTSNQAQATVTAQQTRALAIDKTAQEATYAAVGDVIHYSYKVTNTGNVTLHDSISITVNDNKAAAICPALPAGGLAPAAWITCSATYTIQQSDLDAGSLTNVASATDGTTTSPTDTVTVPATQSPALALIKSASPATYTTAGQTIAYSYELKNTGNVTLAGPFTVTDDKATVTCPAVASLAPNATLTCTASYTITQADLDARSVKNTAQGHASFNDAPVDSNSDDEMVTAEQKPALTLIKTASPSTYDAANQTISYSYKLTNTGNVTLVGPFSVADDKTTVTCTQPADGALSPGEEMTCQANYVITQADLDDGSVTNTAKAKGSFGGQDVFSNEDSKTVNADPEAGAVAGQERQPDHVRHLEPEHRLQLRAEEHRQRDPRRAVHRHR